MSMLCDQDGSRDKLIIGALAGQMALAKRVEAAREMSDVAGKA
jgi:hypothetical protein